MAVQRDDNVDPHNTQATQRKALTALSTKTPTRLLAANARANPKSRNLNTMNALVLIGGGVPLHVGNDVIGTLGVGGGRCGARRKLRDAGDCQSAARSGGCPVLFSTTNDVSFYFDLKENSP